MLIGAVAYGLVRFAQQFTQQYIVGAVEDAAPGNIAEARRLFAEGKSVEARDLLGPIIARVKDDAIAPKALILLAQIEHSEGATDQALALLKRATNEFPNGPEWPTAAIAYGRLLEETGQVQEAVAVYEQVRAGAPRDRRAPALTGLGRQAERDADPIAARELYRQAVDEAEWNGEAWNEALDALGRLNVALIFASDKLPESKICTVKPGDTLTDIGIALNTTQGLLIRANNITDPSKLHPGQQLKYTPKDFRIVIERSTCRLFLLDKDGIFKRYAVGLGMEGHRTTLGSFKIGNKEKDPTWFKPGAEPIPPGDPRNELGTRWMPFIPEEESLPRDLGIHGTVKSETVGTYSSRGCARLISQDVEELYDLVVRSTPVDIVDVFQPEVPG